MNIKLSKTKYNLLLYLSLAISAAIVFILVYGTKILNVCYDEWILYKMDDLTQNYLGWKAYRASMWNFPIGMIDNVIEPFKLSIYYTDSIPIISLFCKILSPLLPNKFQYFGIYGLLCFILISIFSARLLSKYNNNPIFLILSSIFILLQPVLYERMFGHTALASHFIIIYGLYYIFNYKFDKRISISFMIIFPILATSFHLYFMPMCFMIIFIYALLESIHYKKIYVFFIIVSSFLLISILNIYFFGGFNTVGDFTDDSIGNETLNLNCLFQSLGRSRFFKMLPIHTIFANESFLYVGLGGMFLIVIFISLFIYYKKYKVYFENKYLVIGIILLVFISFIVSVVPDIYFNDKLLVHIEFPKIIKYVFTIFRSNARFIWVGYYTSLFVILILIERSINNKFSIAIVLLSIILQVVDYGNLLKYGINIYYANTVKYETSLDLEVWNKIFSNKDIKKLVYLSITPPKDRLEISNFCLENKIITNDFYFARPVNVTKPFNDNLVKLVKENPDDTVFLMTKSYFVINPFPNKKMVVTDDLVLFYPDKM